MLLALTGPAEPPPRSRYSEAFWWVLPVPGGLVVGVVALVRHPSIVGGAGLVALAGVGLVLETVVWRHLRRRWTGDTASHPMDIPEPLRQPIEVGMLLAMIVGALTWKAVGLGYAWLSGFLTGLGLPAFYLVGWLVDRSVNR